MVKIRPISRDLPSNPLPTPPARPPRHRPCVPRLPPGGTLDGRRAQAGAGRLPCPRPPPTGQFRVCPKLSPANWPVWGCPKIWVCPKRPARRPAAAPKAPRPQGRPTGVRGPARARRGQNISLVRDGGERLPGSAPSSRIYISARDYPPPGPRLGPSRPRRSPRPPGDGARPAWQGAAPPDSPSTGQLRVCPNQSHQLAN